MNIRLINRQLSFAAALLATATLTLGAAAAGAASTSPAGSAKYEAWLNNQVRHQLAMLPYYGVFDNLTYTVNGTEVNLGGQVVNATLKAQAESAVKHLEGVTRVENDIEILPLSSFDNQIRRAEYRAIFRDASLNRYRMGAIPAIHIIVSNGHVTLEGVVDNGTDRNIATLRANAVPNVFSVTNHLRVA